MRTPTRQLLILAALAASAPSQTEGALSKTLASGPHQLSIVRPAVLPQAISSFGAARAGAWLYVFGGHIGREHRHTTHNTVGSFRRLNLADGKSWEELRAGPSLQGTALVAAPDGSLYRIGGMAARNQPGEEEDLHSTDSVQRFDPQTGRWQEATPLPEPRSSHDAVVLGDQLYVAGGWQLAGDAGSTWHDTAWVADLREQPLVWKPTPPPPFRRRACALAVHSQRIAVLGGIDEQRPSSAVNFFDPKTATWTEGPALPGPGFGAAALQVGDTLFASGMDGRLFRLDADASDWSVCGQLALPRFFHRLALALDETHLVAIGGASLDGHLRSIELVPLSGETTPSIQEWVLPLPGRAHSGQSLTVHNDLLHVFGGRGDAAAGSEAWRINLLDLRATSIGRLPAPRANLVAVPWDDGERSLLLGGDASASPAEVFSFRSRRRAGGCKILRDGPGLPAPRAQFQAVEHDGVVWLFGGTKADGSGATEVLVCDLQSKERQFVPSGVVLPRARHSFGASVLDSKCYLMGGASTEGEVLDTCDVFDFATRQWSEIPAPPGTWLSPRVCTLGDRLYVSGGISKQHDATTEDSALLSFSPEAGWSTVCELPFSARTSHMLTLRDRLLFYSSESPRGDRITIRLFKPRADVVVPVVWSF